MQVNCIITNSGLLQLRAETTPRKRRKKNPKDDDDSDADVFPIMNLPVEIRGTIFNMLNQRAVPDLRLVCKQWASEVDQLYEFSINLYDTTTKLSRIYELRVRECTVWKFTVTLTTPTLFKHMKFLKVLKITGPTTAPNLQLLISTAEELEQLTISRRANFPWILNMLDTPQLAKLTKLKSLRLNSEEHIMLRVHPEADKENSQFNIRQIPLMDCCFPSLREFQIYKRFHRWNSHIFITYILNFVGRHHKTLKEIELNLTPLSDVSLRRFRNNDNSSSDEDTDEANQPNEIRPPQPLNLSAKEIDMTSLCSVRLTNCSVTTQGSRLDLAVWMKLVENQKELKELYFHWISNKISDDEKKIGGVPWTYFRSPILNCSETLVTVELVNLSMAVQDLDSDDLYFVPFNLEVFRTCNKLKTLTLRCPENHGNTQIEIGGEVAQPAESEQILLINGSDLPESVESLEIAYFPMLTTDIEAMITKCVNLKRLFLKECGKTGDNGITGEIISYIAELQHLKFLEIIGFNDSTEKKKQKLELVCLAIGIPYIEGDTWLEFNNGASSAYEALKVLQLYKLR